MVEDSSSSFSHLIARGQRLVSATNEERLRSLEEPRWIGYSLATSLLNKLRELKDSPRHLRPSNLLIVAEPGNGKTTLVRHFYENDGQASQDREGDPMRPIILCQASSGDEKSLYIAILEEFNAVYRKTESATLLKYQVIRMMRTCQVRLLIIDELHSILTGTGLKQREIMNAIKFLCNELQIPIVGVGTNAAVQVIKTDPQHTSRFEVARLRNWALDGEFQKLLSSFERVLPLRCPSKLGQAEMAKALHSISGGNIGNLSVLLTACARAAIESGKEQITPEIVEKHRWVGRLEDGIRELPL